VLPEQQPEEAEGKLDPKLLVIGGLAVAALAAGGIFLATRKKG